MSKRLMKDLRELAKSPPPGVTCSDVEDQPDAEGILRLRAFISGPKDTPYEGGTFEVKVFLSRQYPIQPPSVKFLTSVWHPNISKSGGAVCVDFLQGMWSPVCNLGTTLTTIQLLLGQPNPDSPLNTDAAIMLREDPEAYHKFVRRHVHQHAGGPDPDAPAAPPQPPSPRHADGDGEDGGGGGGGGSGSPRASAPTPAPAATSPSASSEGPPPTAAPVVTVDLTDEPDLACHEVVPPASPRKRPRGRTRAYDDEARADDVCRDWVQNVRAKLNRLDSIRKRSSELDDIFVDGMNYSDGITVANEILGGFPDGMFRCEHFVMMCDAAQAYGEAVGERLRREGLEVYMGQVRELY